MASDESRALFQRLTEGVAASVRRQMTAERRGERFRSTALLVLALLVLWGAIRWAIGPGSPIRRAMDAPRSQATATESPSPAGPPLSPGIEAPETFGMPSSAATLRTRASIDEGTGKAAKARQRQFLYSVEDVVQAIADAEASRKSFEASVQGLMASDAGKRIAATQRGVPRFLAITEPGRTSAARLAQLAQLVETIAEPVRKAHRDDQNYAVPAEPQERMLAAVQSEAERARTQYAEAVSDLAALGRAAGSPGASSNGASYPAPTVKTLREAVEDYRLDLRSAAIEERERRLDEQRKANEERLTRAEIERERAKGQADLDRVERDARERDEQRKEVAQAKQAEAERRRLLAKARDPRVRQLLTPFLKPGFMQPKEWQGTFLAFERTTEEKPMSLAALRSVGALEPNANGLGSLAWVAGDIKDDRPRWHFGHMNSWSAETQRYVASVQSLLRELADVLVEEGMLSK